MKLEPWRIAVAATIALLASAAHAEAPCVATASPGWTFTEDETPEFALPADEGECQKEEAASPGTPPAAPHAANAMAWRLSDWRGAVVRRGEWPSNGLLALAPLPPGFYRVEPDHGGAFAAFDFCVVRRDPCRNPESPFAVDSALSHRSATFDCPWHGGDTFRVVCELMRKCGVTQTRERMVWKGMNPEPGVFTYKRWLDNAEHLRANALVTTGIFAGTPAHAGGEEIGRRHLPTDLMALYTLMTNAVPAFGDTYNAWGFWNEPDLQMVPEPVWDYVAAFKAFALAVRAANPEKPVLLGALSDVPDKDFGGCLAANEFQKYADIFNIHTYLEPARLPDWSRAADRTDSRAVFDVLAVTGGIPRYLEEIDPGLSADENLRRLCFTPSGTLFKDFNEIFSQVFGGEATQKRDILRRLADGPLTGAELARATGSADNGHFTDVLRELELAGFVTGDGGVNPATGVRARVSKYRIRDNYTRFYLRYVEPHLAEIEGGSFRLSSVDRLPGWDAAMGLQFENLIVNHAMELVPRLLLGGAIVTSAAHYRHARDSRGGGVQIDLLIQTERSAYLVEIKRQNRIGREIEDEVETKMRRLPVRRGVSIHPVLVHLGEVSGEVDGDGFFDAIIPAESLLQSC